MTPAPSADGAGPSPGAPAPGAHAASPGGSPDAIAIELRGITKLFPGVRANDDVDLVVRRGEVHCLLGENGVGKSTLMNELAGICQPNEGAILVGSLLFGLALSVATAVQLVGIDIPTDVIQMLPFVPVMVALALFARRSYLPDASGVPFVRGNH